MAERSLQMLNPMRFVPPALRPFLPIPLILITTLVLARQVHTRTGDEQFVCEDGATCALGSGWSWFLTGIALSAPLIVHLGWRWTARLQRQGKLDPRRRLAIPDYEEMIEFVLFVASVALSGWIIRSGPHIPLVDGGAPNTWLGERLGLVDGNPLVPARRAWFLMGVILSAPFSLAFGAAAGREWYGWQRRRDERAAAPRPQPRPAVAGAPSTAMTADTAEPAALPQSDERPQPNDEEGPADSSIIRRWGRDDPEETSADEESSDGPESESE